MDIPYIQDIWNGYSIRHKEQIVLGRYAVRMTLGNLKYLRWHDTARLNQ